MKCREILRFEIRYLLRHFSTWLLFLVFLVFGFIILRLVTLTDGTNYNAPGTIAFFTIFANFIWVVIGGGIAGEAATRDFQINMHPLSFTAPVSKRSYLGGRFLAALILNLMILFFLYLGFLISLYGPGFNPEFRSPFRFASYLTNFAYLAVPTVVATTSIQFTFAALSRRPIAGYLASIAIIIFSQFGGTTVLYALDWKVTGGLMDLLGTSIAADMEGWSPIEKNTRLIRLEGLWFWNRLLWFAIAVGVLALTYFKFNMRHVTQNSGWNLFRRRSAEKLSKGKTSSETAVEKHRIFQSITVPKFPRNFRFATYVRQVLALAHTSFLVVAGSRAGLTIVAILAIGTGLFATEYMQFFGVPLYARTEEVLRILTPALGTYKTHWIIIPLLIIFYASELIWREREAGINELYDTVPVPEAVAFLGKFLGMAMVIAFWMSFLMIAGIINQLIMGYYNFEILVYVKALFGFQFTNYLLFALLILVIHVLVNQKYLGLMVALGAYGFILFTPTLGIEHKMLIYASDTGWSYSDMSGFDPFLKPWLWFKFYWASWSFLLAVIAMLFWVRSRESEFGARIYQARHRLGNYKPALIIALILVLLSGGFVFYNTNIRNEYLQKSDYMETRVEYERHYSKYKSAVQPEMAVTKLHVEIYPEENSAEIHATYHLVNRSNVSIDSLHFTTIPRQEIENVSFDRQASPVVIDDKLGYRIYFLEEPLNPGDSILMKFLVNIRQHGFSNDGVDLSVIGNGSHIKRGDWMPTIGFDDDRRLYEERDREKFGLPVRPIRPSLYDVEARYDDRHAQQINFEAVIGTAKDQIAVAPGALQREWTKGDRRYFHYATNAPIHNDYAIFSAQYAVREAEWVPEPGENFAEIFADSIQPSNRTSKPVKIQVFYHPEHDENIDRMLKSAKVSMEYYSKEFGPYPYSHFRVLERPGPGRGMHAEPMTIDYASGYSLMNPQPDGLDLPYHIMSHEVAHQWWGFYLSPATVEGSGVLVESLATYSAMQVVEEALGYEHLMRYLSQMRQEYEVPRSQAAPPLLRANNSFLNYRKGPFAFYVLRNYIGKDRVNDALRQLLKEKPSEPPLPTTLDLYRELQAVTPDTLQYLVKDLFAENTFWELKTDVATTKKLETGMWQVTLEVKARKIAVDSMGIETEVPMKDWIEIGVYAPREKDKSSGKEIYLKKHRINSGKKRFIINVSEEPNNAGIDPNHLLIDLNLQNNTRKVKIDGVKEEEEEKGIL
ncbi:ABC transporter permease/M1 family aminopeptidase [Gillisia limnaea]|uniref:Peptidase M1 membrane alanine aminopeptidase domain-containing protein n=2 Tax=Gillisia limnaea (strain DSM 15749 / LMG 21470 / R-8282) TaxID=865937 RepID=H2BUJ4_GILLR|nr:ABC transporter permease [Gillisia limnaea]EHQ03872.1 hypothetical protein Gilli_3265 [Gillisia limnaea DSM 15749]